MALPTSGRSLPGTQDRETFDEITSTFGIGFNGPLIMTVDIVELDDPIEALDGLKADIEKMPGVHMVAASTPNANVDTGMVQIIPTTGPDDPATAALVEQLRERQAEWQQRYDVNTEITGFTAIQIDVTNRLRRRCCRSASSWSGCRWCCWRWCSARSGCRSRPRWATC